MCGLDICHRCVNLRKEFNHDTFSEEDLRNILIMSGISGASMDVRMNAYFNITPDALKKYNDLNQKYKE